MKKAVFVMIPALLVLLSPCVFSQTDEPAKPTPPPSAEAASPCPRLEIQSPAMRTVREGQPVMFVANISGGDKTVTPSIVWSVSAGVIKDGQGTRRIEVDTHGGGADRQIVADLWLGGYAAECGSQAPAQSIRVVPPASKADEFGDLAVDKENERIEAIAGALSQSSDNLYVIAYAGRSNVRGYAGTALRRIKAQLATRGIPANRIGAVDGGFREQPAYELWIVPEGAEPPRPTPTIDRKEIVYPATPRRTTPSKP